MSGLLTLIPTPIGNLDDITLRAIEELKACDKILAEDTRHTSRLLKHLGIETKMIPYHQHNEHRSLTNILNHLKSGEKLALVTDAGTPGISDPGFLLVRECIREGIDVKSLPGATAFIPALVNSGLPCDRFVFEGFLPHKKGRKKRMEFLESETRTMVFYESPHRILKTLKELGEFFGNDRQASISRELTKIHEENLRGSLLEISEILEKRGGVKGEIVLVVAGNS